VSRLDATFRSICTRTDVAESASNPDDRRGSSFHLLVQSYLFERGVERTRINQPPKAEAAVDDGSCWVDILSFRGMGLLNKICKFIGEIFLDEIDDEQTGGSGWRDNNESPCLSQLGL